MIDEYSVKKLLAFVKYLSKPYFIHAGFGLHLHGFPSELDDIDVRVFHSNLDDIYVAAKSFFDCPVRIIENGPGKFGKYLFPRVEIDLPTPVDICTRTGVLNNLGMFEFPFSKEVFEEAKVVAYKDIEVQVASLETLLLYYIALRRDRDDNKNDGEKITSLLSSKKVDLNKMIEQIGDIEKSNKIKKLIDEYCFENR